MYNINQREFDLGGGIFMLSMSILKTVIIVVLIIAIIVAIIKKLVKLLIFVLALIVIMTGYFMFRYNMTLDETITQYKEDIHYGIVMSKDIRSIAEDVNKITEYTKENNKTKEIDSCISDTERCRNEIKSVPHSKALDKYLDNMLAKLDNLISTEKSISQAYKVKNNTKVQDALNGLNTIMDSLKQP